MFYLYQVNFILMTTGHTGVEGEAMWALGIMWSAHSRKEVLSKVRFVWPSTRHDSGLSNRLISFYRCLNKLGYAT